MRPTKKSLTRLIVIFFSAVAFTSCATLKPSTMTPDKIVLSPENINNMTGQFERGSGDIRDADLFWNFYLEAREGNKVDLHVVDSRHIKVSLLKDTTAIKSRLLKGRIKEAHFEFRRRIKIYPLILGNVFKNGKVRITLTTSDNLIVDARDLLYGHIFIFPIVDGNKKYGKIHKRLY